MEKDTVPKLLSEPFCNACLSVGRKLKPLGKYTDIYYKICSGICKVRNQILICWECHAILKKAIKFENCVKKSQEILKSFNSRQNLFQNGSLTHLKVFHTDPELTINITHDELTDQKLVKNIKEEEEESLDNYDNEFNEHTDNINSELLVEDIKLDETLKEEASMPGIKKEICDIKKVKPYSKKPKRYKYVYDKICKADVERLSIKVPIELNEVKYWLERDRESPAYRKAIYKCEMCVNTWKTKLGLLGHNKKYHDLSNPFTCDICACRFRHKRQLARHVARHRWVRECGTCRRRARHITRHLAEHTRRLQCAACGSTGFINIRQLYRHHKELHEVFVCDHCGKRCRSKHMLEKHMRRHFETYHCAPCDKRYKTRATYRKHYITRHCRATATVEQAYCAPCDKQFTSAPLYRRHVASSGAHAAERGLPHRTTNKVACPLCTRVYSRKTYMTNHYRHVHMNQSRYRCERCDRANKVAYPLCTRVYSRKTYMTNHYRHVLMNQSRYRCERCDRHFLNRTRYVDHMRYKHEGVKKEKNKLCNICGRGFAANRTLINHIRTHSGERPFECPHCGGKFTQKHAMLSHVRHVHVNGKRRVWQQE